ncbi:hypothetical protein BLOT_009322, partial [Blomia tropicalis]
RHQSNYEISLRNFFADFLSRHASNARFTKTRLVKNGEDFTNEEGQTVPKILGIVSNQVKEINAVITRNDPSGNLKRAQADCPVISDLIASIERGDQISNFELDKCVLVEISSGFAIAKAVTSNSTAVTAKFIMNDLVPFLTWHIFPFHLPHYFRDAVDTMSIKFQFQLQVLMGR